MAGISGESLKAALADLESVLPTASLPLAEELFGILATLDSSAGLRRALTDPSRSAEAKAALVRSLVNGKVSAQAGDLAAALAASRWANVRDLGDALETMAATVAIAVAENRPGSSSGGAVSGISGLEQLESDLFAFSRAVDSSHEVQRALSEPQASDAAKSALAMKLVPAAGEEARVLIQQAVSHPRGIKATKLVECFATLAAERQQRWIAAVSVSRPLTPAQLDRLQSGLNALYGRELKVNTIVDPTLIGGVRVRVGDEVVDASVISRLGDLRRQLAG
ncbi:F0F1 ATP synthase subunit delta [Paenarthrobacter sp. Z7-10]|uniref:F0F1 ATP synthase subunit delta n=1 Tax=Paenarthrobacter sp. Z7-10 TaxID=2787635 RepID=UPI0022A97339|nr:F0F1 ATP synthase subunit delta [Paenarthrobacter sp. Z7-10]MCZ2402409.1 F0F1 ATP synthase subunit delta [Paenarthrobacter sp. Z7-10]